MVNDEGFPTHVEDQLRQDSATWMTLDEFEMCIWKKTSPADINYKVLCAAARAFEDNEFDVRFVMWFNN